MDMFAYLLTLAGLVLVALVAIGLILSRLYRRASKETSYVRTGMGGQKVIMNGGALVFPVLHEVIPVNMNTLRLEVSRANDQALITRDRMRVDVKAEFYVRVQPTADSIANAAQTLGKRTMYPEMLKELVEGKFVDALRAVAAEMTMEELHEQRVEFVQKVQKAVSEDLLKNGLELESVSLTGLDQTEREHFNPNNAFDAAGLTRLIDEIESRRKRRNEIERDTEVAINLKDLEAERKTLEISRDTEYARLEQQREVAIRKAEQNAQVSIEEANKVRESEQAKISAAQMVELSRIEADRGIEESRIDKDRRIREKEIDRERIVETAEVNRNKSIELSNQDKAIAIAEKSKEQSEMEASAHTARGKSVKAEEEVETIRQTQMAERAKSVDLVEARQRAEREAIALTVKAQAEKQAAEDEAGAIRILAEAAAEKLRITAQGEADAEIMKAAAAQKRYVVEAEGRKALNLAENELSSEVIQLKIKTAVIQNLQSIIRESVKPMENIDGIKIINIDGLKAGGANGTDSAGAAAAVGSLSMSDQVVDSALRYRSQAPLIDALMKEVGLSGDSLEGMVKSVASDMLGGNSKPDPRQIKGVVKGRAASGPKKAPPHAKATPKS